MDILEDVVMLSAILVGAISAVCSAIMLLYSFIARDLEKLRAAVIIIIFVIALVVNKWVVLPILIYLSLLIVVLLLWTFFDLLRLSWFAKPLRSLLVHLFLAGRDLVCFLLHI